MFSVATDHACNGLGVAVEEEVEFGCTTGIRVMDQAVAPADRFLDGSMSF